MKRTIIIVFFAFWGTLFAAAQESFKVSFDLRYDAQRRFLQFPSNQDALCQ